MNEVWLKYKPPNVTTYHVGVRDKVIDRRNINIELRHIAEHKYVIKEISLVRTMNLVG